MYEHLLEQNLCKTRIQLSQIKEFNATRILKKMYDRYFSSLKQSYDHLKIHSHIKIKA
jgi:hypothetical protein